MEKAGLKTFVYSFVFSLFAAFSANSVYLRAQATQNQTLKIPNRNITLFLKEESKLITATDAAPVKKIVLSVIPEIPKEKDPLTDKIPLVIDDFLEKKAPTKILASTSDIPLQIDFAQETAKTVALPQEKLIENFEEVISSPPPVNEKELTPIVAELKIDSQAISDEEKLPPKGAIEQKITSEEPEKPLELVALEYHKPKVHKEITEPKAMPDMPAETPSISKKNTLLIPLEKNIGIIRTGNKKIEIVNQAQVNQVALNTASVPIKSMVSQEAPNPDTATASTQEDLKWQSMAEIKSSESKKDDPWEVTIGSKHPRNKAILESDAYRKDEKEIRQLLNSKEDQPFNSNEKNIELASGTVKNILIPIPEDILNDDNLTPQLVSSKKNKQVEDEMAAKEALKEEERLQKDNTQKSLEQNLLATSADQTQQPITEEKKGSILSSISSIFSGSKSSPPQIGVQPGNDEEQNSLLNAFKRKGVRSSGGKILPTEIRLSFQPNRAEISGQTLKWIRAFANKTIEEPSTGLEIRIDGTSSPLMQQRRLNLLQNILGGEGVDFNKVNTIFTSREPNSFIIRTVRLNNATKDMPEKQNNARNNNYTQW